MVGQGAQTGLVQHCVGGWEVSGRYGRLGRKARVPVCTGTLRKPRQELLTARGPDRAGQPPTILAACSPKSELPAGKLLPVLRLLFW